MLRGSGMKASATFLLLLLAAAAGGSGKKDGEAQGPVSARHSRLYGPALDSRVVTSARYLYVQAKDAQGRNFTHSPGSDAFSVKVFVIVNGKAQMLKTELNDRGDGSFQASGP
ncbi:hypothetical protein T484DRAFT_1856929 [Baffinella frigidus]|nr:hypothetical protein T484DRAFT_1856929 [Cryptophyta sp. CCMP2293]